MKKQPQAAYTIYHNPRCSKSRATLALLLEHGVAPLVIEYLSTPPSEAELAAVLVKLDMQPRELVRSGEAAFKEKVAGQQLTDAQLLAAMVENPILIERPIVVVGERAVLGRPPENVLTLLD